MEILNTTDHIVEFSIFIILISVMILLFGSLMLVGLTNLIQHRDYKDDLLLTIVCTTITAFSIFAMVMWINQGVRVSYDVKVSDWNEVYDQGYTVIKQDGDIITIELKGE